MKRAVDRLREAQEKYTAIGESADQAHANLARVSRKAELLRGELQQVRRETAEMREVFAAWITEMKALGRSRRFVVAMFVAWWAG